MLEQTAVLTNRQKSNKCKTNFQGYRYKAPVRLWLLAVPKQLFLLINSMYLIAIDWQACQKALSLDTLFQMLNACETKFRRHFRKKNPLEQDLQMYAQILQAKF